MTAASAIMKSWRAHNKERDRRNQYNYRLRHRRQKAAYDKDRHTVARNIRQTIFWWGGSHDCPQYR
jgi:hypothetical protein